KRWEEQGRQHGREEGRAQGLQRGLRRGRAEVSLKQLRLRFGSVPAEAQQRVERASAEELDRWTERVLTAGSLEHVAALSSRVTRASRRGRRFRRGRCGPRRARRRSGRT